MPLFQHEFRLDTLTRIAEAFKRSSLFIDRDILGRVRPDDVKVYTPQIKVRPLCP